MTNFKVNFRLTNLQFTFVIVSALLIFNSYFVEINAAKQQLNNKLLKNVTAEDHNAGQQLKQNLTKGIGNDIGKNGKEVNNIMYPSAEEDKYDRSSSDDSGSVLKKELNNLPNMEKEKPTHVEKPISDVLAVEDKIPAPENEVKDATNEFVSPQKVEKKIEASDDVEEAAAPGDEKNAENIGPPEGNIQENVEEKVADGEDEESGIEESGNEEPGNKEPGNEGNSIVEEKQEQTSNGASSIYEKARDSIMLMVFVFVFVFANIIYLSI